MDITVQLIIIGILLVVLMILVVSLITRSAKKKPVVKQAPVPKPAPAIKSKQRSFEELLAVLKSEQSERRDLGKAVDEIIRHYGHITEKLGSRPHPDFDKYALAIMLLCRHRQTNKEILLDFDRRLTRRNPEYKRQINEAISKGLNAR